MPQSFARNERSEYKVASLGNHLNSNLVNDSNEKLTFLDCSAEAERMDSLPTPDVREHRIRRKKRK